MLKRCRREPSCIVSRRMAPLVLKVPLQKAFADSFLRGLSLDDNGTVEEKMLIEVNKGITVER